MSLGEGAMETLGAVSGGDLRKAITTLQSAVRLKARGCLLGHVRAVRACRTALGQLSLVVHMSASPVHIPRFAPVMSRVGTLATQTDSTVLALPSAAADVAPTSAACCVQGPAVEAGTLTDVASARRLQGICRVIWIGQGRVTGKG